MIEDIRNQFPILQQKIYGQPLIYFDNAATTQKPQCVIDCCHRLNTQLNANVHRGLHYMSDQCTNLYEEARVAIQHFLNARQSKEIVFTSGTTHGINLVAFSFGEQFIKAGDEIVISEMEHHSNIVPWQLLCERKKAVLRVLPFTDEGNLEIEQLVDFLTPKTKLLAITHASNMLGTINPVKEMIAVAHLHGIPVLIDGAQYVSHDKVDVQDLDCDFYVFSGHKLFAPTGIGVLYGKSEWLEQMPPYQGGGDMVDRVSFSGTTYAELPLKFEAGTTNFQGAIALGEAIRFCNQLPKEIKKYKIELLEYLTQQLLQIEGLTIYGNSAHKVCLATFTIDGVHALDLTQMMDKTGVALRSGTLCTQPILQHYNITSVTRASLSIYNTMEEIDQFIMSLKKCIMMLR